MLVGGDMWHSMLVALAVALACCSSNMLLPHDLENQEMLGHISISIFETYLSGSL